MNTYSKFGPNVFLAKCIERHAKGDIINVTTKYGKENESEVFNLIYEKDGFFFYSIIRADGFNIQERAKAKSEKYESWAGKADQKSNEYYHRSKDMMSVIPMGQPVHGVADRNYRDKAWAKMGKSVEFSDKASAHESKVNYWAKKANDINLSMPESIEFYEYKLEAAKLEHEGMKNGTIERGHSMALQYAKKAVNEAQKNFDLAKKLWG